MADMFHMKQVCVLGCQKEFKIWHILGFFSKRGKVQLPRCWMERELGYLGCLRDLGAEQPTIAVVSLRGIGLYCKRGIATGLHYFKAHHAGGEYFRV